MNADARFPKDAVAYGLDEAGIEPEALDHVVFCDEPLLKFERLIESWIGATQRGFGLFVFLAGPGLAPFLYPLF